MQLTIKFGLAKQTLLLIALAAASASAAHPKLCVGLSQSYALESFKIGRTDSPVTVAKELTKFLSVIDRFEKPSDLTASAGLFEVPIRKLMENIEQTIALDPRFKEPHMSALFEQLRMKVKHTQIDAEGGRYAFDASMYTLRRILDFYEAMNPHLQQKSQARPALSKEKFEQIKAQSVQKDQAETSRVFANPDMAYQQFSLRLRQDGKESARFPEFEATIEFLYAHLLSESVDAPIRSKGFVLAGLRERILGEIESVKQSGFPYLKSLEAIENALAFLDVVERGKPGSTAVGLYHSLRWQYHSAIMKASAPEFVLFPTIYSLGITDLLKVRGVPIGMLGVSAENLYADGHYQSPLEFWFHDINHSRRMWQQYEQRARELGMSVSQYREMSHRFIIDEVLPMVAIQKTDSAEIRDIKRVMKVILFEIVHEDALPMDREMLKESLSRAPLEIGRFVFETLDRDLKKVTYSRSYNATVLSITFRKLEGEFYDMGSMRIGALGSDKARTRDFVLKAAQSMNEILQLRISDQELIRNVADDSGLPLDLRKKIISGATSNPEKIQPLQEHRAEEVMRETGNLPTSVPFFEK